MNGIFGAPSTGVPLSWTEVNAVRENDRFSKEIMREQLLAMTESERRLKRGDSTPIVYDYLAFRQEKSVFAEGSTVHVLRHLRYDRHERHSHEFYEIVCQLSGESQLNVESEKIPMTAGNICLIAPGMTHCIHADSDDSILLKIIMRRTDFDKIFSPLQRTRSLLTRFLTSALYGEGAGWLLFETGADESIDELLLRLRWHEVRGGMTDEIMKEALVMEFFCILTERYMNRTKAAFADDLAGRILVTIGEQFRTISLKELSKQYHFTEGYISRIIKRASGHSFCELINILKIEHACRLLEGTDRPIATIIEECGFGCKEFFCKTFKRLRGMPPSEWRKCTRNEEIS